MRLRFHRSRAAWAAPVLAFLAACSDASGPGGPRELRPAQDSAYLGQVGQPVADSVAVRVVDGRGRGVPGVTVRWEVVDGGGQVSPAQSTSDGRGVARARWTLGPAVGLQRLRAQAEGLAPVVLSARARAGAPSQLELRSASEPSGEVGTALADPVAVAVRDAFGNPVEGARVLFEAYDGGRLGPAASDSAVAVAADVAGVARVAWTLGPRRGRQRLVVSLPGTTLRREIVATARPGAPVTAIPVAGGNQSATVGTALPEPVVIEVQDRFGNGVPGVAVRFVPAAGGAVERADAVTDSLGRASPGRWTLGTTAGVQTLLVQSATFASTLTAVARPDAPTGLAPEAGDGQTAPAGLPVEVAPTVRVRDRFGNGVPGVAVTFRADGGRVALATATTDAQGRASAGAWSLGPEVGVQSVIAEAPGLGSVRFSATATARTTPYAIELVFLTPASPSQVRAFRDAVARWAQVIVGDEPDIDFNDQACGADTERLTRRIDDLLILVELVPIDGPGAVLGSAGACWIRTPSYHSIIGRMRFDVADLETMEQRGGLYEVILHEIGHILGISGGFWDRLGFLRGRGTADPRYIGPKGVAGYRAIGGRDTTVAVENQGGSGTRDTHWRESVFGNELMTGYYNYGVRNPLSRMTIGALDDLGYTVSYEAADAFSGSFNRVGDAGGAPPAGVRELREAPPPWPVRSLPVGEGPRRSRPLPQ